MTTAEIAALTTAQISHGLSTSQIAALTTGQIGALRTAQIASLTTGQIVALTTAEISALTTVQTTSLTIPQRLALTTAQIPYVIFEQRRRVEASTGSQVSSLSVPAVQQITPADSTNPTLNTKVTLRQKVGDLVQAMASFDAQATASGVAAAGIPSLPNQSAAGNLAVASKVSGIVDALKPFDANGNPVARPGNTTAPNGQLGLTRLHHPADSGFLATPGK